MVKFQTDFKIFLLIKGALFVIEAQRPETGKSEDMCAHAGAHTTNHKPLILFIFCRLFFAET
jgi:hypothetical protein